MYYLWLILVECAHDGGSGGFIGRILRSIYRWRTESQLRAHGVHRDSNGGLRLDDGLDDLDEENEASFDDPDVAAERRFVSENKDELRSTASVFVSNLWKVYPPSTSSFLSGFAFLKPICRCIFRNRGTNTDSSGKPKRAVRGLTTSIGEGEIYGLLGINGAGKTTTLGMLTGDLISTGGEACVVGNDITGNDMGGVARARKYIGFCPQTDPLLDLMTARETLRLFGRLRGIPNDRIDAHVSGLLEHLTLTPHADKTSNSYSGGNKRKLSLGIALVGNPRVLIVDESSSGMDPGAKRKMWELIQEAAKERSVILTTHSMEEAEALCTRVGIMISGRLRCLGSVQHLKTTFVDGYTISIHCKGNLSSRSIDSLVDELLNKTLPGAELNERHGRFLKIAISSVNTSSLGMGEVFRRLRAMKTNAESKIDYYSVSQCSLEDVFINLVRENEQRRS
mmetsp:Transcript_17988/g.27496  ORF Transcript_17988/g.27496 Transcript_17988/m.27496 type:complete len:452 (+) Transcript_17988:115-1470(+)